VQLAGPQNLSRLLEDAYAQGAAARAPESRVIVAAIRGLLLLGHDYIECLRLFQVLPNQSLPQSKRIIRNYQFTDYLIGIISHRIKINI